MEESAGMIFSAFMGGLVIGCVFGFLAATLSMWSWLRIRYEAKIKYIEQERQGAKEAQPEKYESHRAIHPNIDSLKERT